jgi:hypothetical protein
MELRILDRNSGAVLQRRKFGPGTEFPVASITASGVPVDIFPSRMTSGPMSITLVTPARSTRVLMSRAALVRIEIL